MRNAPAIVVLLGFAMIFAVVGCGGAAEKSESAVEALTEKAEDMAETAGEMAEDVMNMAPDEIQAKVEDLKKEIAEKETELAELTEKLKGMSPTDLAGDTGAQLKEESDKLTQEVTDLKKKLEEYVAKLGE
jgi:uncharacterized protein YukE